MVKIYDSNDKKEIFSHDRSSCASISADGKKAIICFVNSLPKFFDLYSGEFKSDLYLTNALYERDVVWSPCGKYIAIVRVKNDWTCSIEIYRRFNGESFALSYQVPIICSEIQCDAGGVSWSPNSNFLAIKHANKIEIWDLLQQSKVSSFKLQGEEQDSTVDQLNRKNAFAWHPKKNWLVFSHLKKNNSLIKRISFCIPYSSDLYVWDFLTSECIFTAFDTPAVSNVSWNTEENLYLCTNNKILILNFSKYEFLAKLFDKMPLDQALLINAMSDNHCKGHKKYKMDRASYQVYNTLDYFLQKIFEPLIEKRHWIYYSRAYHLVERLKNKYI